MPKQWIISVMASENTRMGRRFSGKSRAITVKQRTLAFFLCQCLNGFLGNPGLPKLSMLVLYSFCAATSCPCYAILISAETYSPGWNKLANKIPRAAAIAVVHRYGTIVFRVYQASLHHLNAQHLKSMAPFSSDAIKRRPLKDHQKIKTC